MLFGKVQLTSTVRTLDIVITLTRSILDFTDVKMGPERSGDLPKMAQHASNQARAELRSLDFCPRQTVILCSYPTKDKQCFSLASPLSLAWKAREMSHSPSAAFKLGSVFWNAHPFSFF